MKSTIIKLTAIMFLFIFIIANASYAEIQTADEWIKKGDAYFVQNNYKDAMDAYNRAINNNPLDGTGYFKRGIANSKLGNYKQAILDFDKTIETTPKNTTPSAMLYTLRGACNSKLGYKQQAIKDFDKAIQINPETADPYYEMACLHSLEKNLTEACSALKKSIELGFDLDNIKKDSDIDNIRNSSCYKEIMSAAENKHKLQFTFLNIGANDNDTSATQKIKDSKKFNILGYIARGNHCGFDFTDPDTWEKFSKNKRMAEIFKLYRSISEAKNINQVKGAMAHELHFDPLENDTMYWPSFSKGSNRYASLISYSAYNKKLLRLSILLNGKYLKEISTMLSNKYGKPTNIVYRDDRSEKKLPLYYIWESEDDLMVLTWTNNMLTFYLREERTPEDLMELNIYFGKNIKEWRDHILTKAADINRSIEDQEMKARKKAVSEF